MRPLALLVGLAPSTALAVPLQFSHQGRVIDAQGPLVGPHAVRITVYSAETGGTVRFTESDSVEFADGYFSTIVGDDTAFDVDDLAAAELWVAVSVDQGAEIGPRQKLVSVPFALAALRATEAVDVVGGVVDASEVRIDGVTVIDGSGQVVAPVAGGLASLGCAPEQIARRTATGWACDADRTLSSSDVVAIVEGGLVTLASGSRVGTKPISTLSLSDVRTDLAGTATALGAGSTVGSKLIATVDDGLTVGQVRSAFATSAVDLGPASRVDGVRIATLDDLASTSEVRADLAATAVTLAAGSTVGGAAIATLGDLPDVGAFAGSDQACTPGQVVTGIDDAGALTCLDIGVITLSDDRPCGLATRGTLQYHVASGELQLCNGASWLTVSHDANDDQTPLYAFTAHTFTTCGKAGRSGPTLAECRSAYSTTWDEQSAFFRMDRPGVQVWVVPATGTYRIEAYGASGGTNNQGTTYPGRGARMRGDFALTKGTELHVLVGQQGEHKDYSGGGGGGTFVVRGDGTPLIVAGGGAGARRGSNDRPTTDATTSSSGRAGGRPGGTNGDGGEAAGPVVNGCGGGGGLLSSGWDSYGNSGGRSFFEGGTGGMCSNPCSQSGVGGFGGGGGAYHNDCSPGGGGYGGGGGVTDSSYYGGGGGSYNAGSNPSNAEAVNTGHGQIVITRL